MGPVIGLLGTFLEAGAGLLSAGIAGISLGSILTIGAIVGLTALSRALNKTQAASVTIGSGGGGYSAQPQPTDVQQTVTQAVPPRRRHYGRVKTGGYRSFFDSVSGILYEDIMVAQGEVHAFEEHWLNDQQVALGSPASVTETAFGSKSGSAGVGGSLSLTYGYDLGSNQKVDYAVIYPTTSVTSAQSNGGVSYTGGDRWGYVLWLADSGFFLPYSGTVRARLYGRRASDSAIILLATETFTNSLVPQYLTSSDQVTDFNRVYVVVDVQASNSSSHNAIGISALDVQYESAAVGNSVVATYSGGSLTSDPFTTTSGSVTVTVYHPSHGFSSGALLAFNGIAAAVRGIPASEFESNHSATVVDGDHYTVALTTAATSSGTGGGTGVRWKKTNSGSTNNYLYGGTYRASIYAQMGEDDQAAQKTLIDAFPTQWGVEHRLAGIANVLCSFQDVPQADFTAVYPQGIPSYRAVLAGALVYDPRDAAQDSSDKTTWVWSDNAALIILDFLTHADGMGRARAFFDETSFAAAADVCDESVALKNGSSEARYRICASYDLTEKPSDVLQRFLAACDGYLYPTTDGKWGLRVGRWYAPTASISSDAVLEYTMQQGASSLIQFNQLKLTYTDPSNDYQETEAEPWEDSDSIAKYGTLTDQLKLLEVPSASQARRLGKIASAKSNPTWKGTVKTTLAGLAAMGEAVVTLTIDELAISETFLLTNFQIAGDLSYCLVEVSSLASTAYDWDATTEEGTAPATAGSNVPLQVPDTPTGFAVIAGQTLIQGSTYGAAAAASWDVPSRDTLSHEIQYKLHTDSQWTSAAVPSGTAAWKSGVLNDGDDYNFRLRAIGPGGAPSGWTSTVTVTMTADTSAPAAPTGLSSSLAGSTATISWTNPTSANFYATKIYRGTTSTFASAALVHTAFGGNGATKSYDDSGLAVGTYYWWAVAENASGVQSSATGPTTKTVT